MRILLINVSCGVGSTGRICTDIANEMMKRGHEVKISYGRETVPEKYKKIAVKIGNEYDIKVHAIKARLYDGAGFGSKKVTKKFVEWIKEFDPDVIHLHNIHGYYINIDVLFQFLRNYGKKIIWTLHDCWPFTGHSAYCDVANCARWITGCYDCPNMREYPKSFTDRSKDNWKKKKFLMQKIPNLTIVTPSEWLAGLVKKSFLSDYKLEVINNGVDISVFKPAKRKKIFNWNLKEKKVILGVASVWDKRKGLQEFYELSKLITDDYIIFLVGLNEEEIKKLPHNIKGVKRTQNIQALAEIYSMATVYINP